MSLTREAEIFLLYLLFYALILTFTRGIISVRMCNENVHYVRRREMRAATVLKISLVSMERRNFPSAYVSHVRDNLIFFFFFFIHTL